MAAANTAALAVGEIAHMKVLVVGNRVAAVAAVAHREALVADRDNFEMEIALHTGWAATAFQAPSHSSCKIVGQKRSRYRMLGSDAQTFVT